MQELSLKPPPEELIPPPSPSTVPSEDIRHLFANHLKDNGITLAWVSNKTGIPYKTLYFILNPPKLKEEHRKKLNELLKTNY